MKPTLFLIALIAPCASVFAAPAQNDATFATKAADGGMAEVATGKLAAQHAQSPAVKSFGEQMVTDHSKANDELKAVAAKNAIDLPSAPSAKHQAAADKLAGFDGRAFDDAYVKLMVQDHTETVALFKKEAATGSNADVKAFANETLPTLQHHLDMIKKIAASKDHE